MLLTAELAALNLDPAQQEGVVAAVLPLHAEAEKLRAQAKLDTLKIQALTSNWHTCDVFVSASKRGPVTGTA